MLRSSRAPLLVIGLLAGLLSVSCSGEDAPAPDAQETVAVDDGDGGASTSREGDDARTASAAIPDFRLTVLSGGCAVQRRVLPPDARIDGLRWQVQGADGRIRRVPAVDAVYTEPRPGRWRVSLTLKRGPRLLHVTRPRTVRC